MDGRSAYGFSHWVCMAQAPCPPLMLKAESHAAPPPPMEKGKKQKAVKSMDADQEKIKVISFRATQSEENKYKQDADIAGLTLSEYIRRRLNGTTIVAKIPLTDRQSIAKLRQIGGLIKQLFKHEKISKNELENSLNKIYNAINIIQNNNNN